MTECQGKTMFEVQIMEQSNIFIIEYSMEYMSTSSLHDTDMGGSTLSRHSLGLKGLNLSIFHHWCNHTNVDLVHHIQSFFLGHDHSCDGTKTHSKYPFGFQVHCCVALRPMNFFHSSSTENSFRFYFFEIIPYILQAYEVVIFSKLFYYLPKARRAEQVTLYVAVPQVIEVVGKSCLHHSVVPGLQGYAVMKKIRIIHNNSPCGSNTYYMQNLQLGFSPK